MWNDLVKYPPTISLIKVLLKIGLKVTYVGCYSDVNGKKSFEQQGVRFVPVVYKNDDFLSICVINHLAIIYRQFEYKRKISEFLKGEGITDNDLIWLIYSDIAAAVQKSIEKYNYVIQFYEFIDYRLGRKISLLHPSFDAERLMKQAKALIHCEYNRAMITNGLFGIKNTPFILPNKPYEEGNEYDNVPDDIKNVVEDIKKRIDGKRAIIYQGIFEPNERRLDEFCEAIKLLPKDMVLICMGGGLGKYFDIIKSKYESDRILFVPFVRPPYHLLVTQLAKYGVLSYFPTSTTYEGVINPLYCAPNKIFEYGKFGIPMIANDCPGLKLIFEEYKCGKIINMPVTPENIADTIVRMESDYASMSEGARAYYDSVDIEQIIRSIIKSC